MTKKELKIKTGRPVKEILYENDSVIVFKQSDYSNDWFFNKENHSFFKNGNKGVCGVLTFRGWNNLPA